MHTLFHLSSSCALFAAISSSVAAGHGPIIPKLQDPAATCADTQCVFSHYYASISSAKTLQNNQAAATTTAVGSGGGPAQVKISVAQPTLCSASVLQFSSAYNVATGSVVIRTAPEATSGWGELGSIWEISANDGVQLENFRVPCAGSSYTGITGNKEEDGSIVKNADGSWKMNVTANMQSSVHLVGEAFRGQPVNDIYDLTVTSTPPCALPVFQNCSGRDFDPTQDQWEAYSTGDFLTKYLADNQLNSLSSLLSKASTDLLPTNPYNVTGISDEAREWLDNLLVTSYINRVLDDAIAFIAFLPHAEYVYTATANPGGEKYNFTLEDCQTNWNNNANWQYYSTCDIPLAGTPGKSSKGWTSEVEWQWADSTWNAHDMVASLVTDFADHGFGYNITNVDFSTILNKGSHDALESWKLLPLSTPGLFNLPVFVMSNMMDIPGGEQPSHDMGKDARFRRDPLTCATSVGDVNGAKFCDSVSQPSRRPFHVQAQTRIDRFLP
ncbi:MAG: hypothetical protein Q9226_002835 [Calogaya cf. arnoldii]